MSSPGPPSSPPRPRTRRVHVQTYLHNKDLLGGIVRPPEPIQPRVVIAKRTRPDSRSASPTLYVFFIIIFFPLSPVPSGN